MKKGFYYFCLSDAIFYFSGEKLDVLCNYGSWVQSLGWTSLDFKKSSPFINYVKDNFEYIG